MNNTRTTLLIKYPVLVRAVPVASVVVALVLSYVFSNLTHNHTFLFLYPALAMGCLFGNRQSNVAAIILAVSGSWLLFFPENAPMLAYFRLGIFSFFGILIIVISDYLNRATKTTLDTENQGKILIENERRNLRNLFKQTPEIVCYLAGPDHLFEFVNEAHIRVLGFDATGKTVREAQPESVEVHEILDGVFRTGRTAELKEIQVTVGNRRRFFNLTYAPRTDENGRINGVMILGLEVTEQVLLRSALEREARLIEAMPSPFFAMNSKWEIIFWNPAAEKVIGLSQKEVLGRILWDIFPGLEDSDFGENYRKTLADKKIHHFEAFYPNFNKWYAVWPFPFEDGVAVSFLDVSDRRAIEDELEKSRERYQMLFDFSPLPKWIIDMDTHKFLDVNLAAVNHYGYSKEEFLSMSAAQIRPKEDLPDFYNTMKRGFTNEIYEKRRRHIKKDGTIIEVEVTALDLTLDGRRCHIGAAVDVTDRVALASRQAELFESLNAAKNEAERASQMKSAFLANMSHEIRTPLGAIIGFADLLRDPNLTWEQRSSYIGIVTRNGEQLSTIINDILDLSKVEAGHMVLDFADTQPDVIATDVVSLLKVKANEKDLVLDYIADESVPATIATDSLRLRQILMNIVGNAIKFTPTGSVKVRSFAKPSENGRTVLYFEVTDTGIGIPKGQTEKIFEVFVQADSALTRKFGGTGLGLALSRQLARGLGGDVVVSKSTEGRGSTFLISVEDRPELISSKSIASMTEKKSVLASENSLDGVKVLVVDDSPENRQLIWLFLNKQGAAVDFAENGLTGYRMALAGNYDVVLMDIQMPEMDGYTATEKLRNAGYRKPIIALTAHAMSEVRTKCLNVGCSDHLTKPIDPNALIETVAHFAAKAPSQTSAPTN